MTPAPDLITAARAYLAAQEATAAHPEDESERAEAEATEAAARARMVAALSRCEAPQPAGEAEPGPLDMLRPRFEPKRESDKQPWDAHPPQPSVTVAEAAITEALNCLDGEPEYHHQGMGCGLEDRNITDRYEAMQYGWDQAMERVYGEHINPARAALRALTGEKA